jgi:ABC-type transport system involved in cytochrome c biogenesis permease component
VTLLPVVARELRVAARRGSSYWGRSLAALVAMGVFAWIFVMERHAAPSQIGQTLFRVIAVLAYVFAALAGVLFSADSISRERREGTLGLLFLTDLRGVDVALGKLTASSLAAVYGLLAVLPVLGVCVLLGGVTGAEYGRVMLVLICALFTSLALGLLASTWAQDSMRAVALAFGLTVAWQFGVPLVWAVSGLVLERLGFDWVGTSPRAEFQPVWWLTPEVALGAAFEDSYRKDAGLYRGAVTVCAFLGLAAVTLASLRLPRLWQVREGGRKLGFGAWLKRLRFGTGDGWARFRRTVLEVHPVAWLSGRYWLRRWLVWGWLGGGFITYATLALISGSNDWWETPPLMLCSFAAHAFLKFWVALEAPRQFFADRRSGALELLLTTPTESSELVRGRLLALRRQFLWPAVAVAGGDVLVLLRALVESPSDGDNPTFALLCLVRVVLLFLDLHALAWVGNWLGLSAEGNRSTVWVVLRLLMLPWAVALVSVLFAGLLAPWTVGNVNWAVVSLVSWLALNVGNNLFWVLRSRHGLLLRFRETATGQVRSGAKSD